MVSIRVSSSSIMVVESHHLVRARRCATAARETSMPRASLLRSAAWTTFRPRLSVFVASLAMGACLASCNSDDTVVSDATSGDEAAAANTGPLRLAGVVPGPYVRLVRGGCLEGPDSCETRGDCEAAAIDCGGADDRIRITAHWPSSDTSICIERSAGRHDELSRPTSLTGGA